MKEQMMASYRRIQVKPIAGALGAEISGVNLRTMDDETFKEIKVAWLEHLVVFFRDQSITPEQQIAFAKRFGEIHHHPFMKSMDEYPDILEIIKEEGDTKAFGEVWHTDQMFNPKPAKATILYAKETPDAGGDTLFANMYRAYEELSSGMQKLIANLHAVHYAGSRKLENTAADRAHAEEQRRLSPPVAHPVVRVHPETGRKAIYLGEKVKRFDGMTEEESRPLIDYLNRHATQPEFVYRHQWQPNDIVLWDNRCTMHQALGDFDETQSRYMERSTLLGTPLGHVVA
jgi:taurine dioxygenase